MGIQAWAMLVTLSLVWGGSFYFVEILVDTLSPMTIVFLRVALAAAFLWIYIAANKISVPGTLDAWRAFFIMGLLNNVIPFTLIVWGQTIISSSLASIMNATVPMFAVVLAAILLKDENITALKIAGVIVGFIGTFSIIAPDLKSFDTGNTLAQLAILGAALSYAFAGIFGRRFHRMGIHPVTTAAGQVTASAVLTFPAMMLIDQPSMVAFPELSVLFALMALALLSTAFAYILYFRILAIAGATNLSLVTFLIPAWASLLGIWLLAEKLSINQIIGVAIIALGLSLIDGRLWSRGRYSS